MIYSELGIFPITVEIRHRAVSYLCKIITDSTNETIGTQKLSTYVYSLIYNMHQNDKLKSQWLNNINNLLCNLGSSGMWESQTVVKANWLFATLKRKLQDQYIQEWSILSNTASSGINYRLIRTNFECSRYFKLLPDNLSQKMSAFRTRNHRLPVEVGRWVGTPFRIRIVYWWNAEMTITHQELQERKCQCCNNVLQERKCQCCNNDFGDEFHYVLKCDLFIDERKQYIKQYYYRNPNKIKDNELMNTTNVPKLKKLATFVCKILNTVRGFS